MNRTAFNAAVAERILALLADAQPYTEIARAEGISVQTLWRWRQADRQPAAPAALADFARQVRALRPQRLPPVQPRPQVYSEELATQALAQLRQGHTLHGTSQRLGLSRTLLSHWVYKSKRPDAPLYLQGFAKRVARARLDGAVARRQKGLEPHEF